MYGQSIETDNTWHTTDNTKQSKQQMQDRKPK